MLRRTSFAWLSFSLLLGVVVFSAEPAAPGGKGYAFLLACGKFDSGQLHELPHAAIDLRQFRDVLAANGYAEENIVLLCDDASDRQDRPEKAKILRRLDTLLARIGSEDTLLVAYEGHSIKFRGDPRNYWCPADARLEERKTLLPTTGDGGLFERLKMCKARRKLLLVDASRKGVVNDTLPATKKLELEDRDEDEVPAGVTAIYSCKPGQRSHFFAVSKPSTDWHQGSLFFQYVADAWEGVEVSESENLTFADLSYIVQWKTAGVARRVFDEPQTPIVRRENKGDASWVLSEKRDALGRFGKIEKFEYEQDGKKYRRQREVVTVDLGDGITMEFVRIPKGTFMMGPAPDDVSDWPEDRKRRVWITKDFFLGKYEVTQEQYLQVVGNNPSAFSRGGRYSKEAGTSDTRRFPVEQVSWEDARRFCSRLPAPVIRRFGSFRLPTEAEWEYACRGGSDTRYGSGDDRERLQEHAWVRQNSDGRTHEVGTRKPNAFGLYDMHGNVQEWCLDCAGPLNTLPARDPVRLEKQDRFDKRIIRGGCWRYTASSSAAGYRSWEYPKEVPDTDEIGFRVAFTLR
jgi:formylglycine-generating enzyme required for sulfatase activity